MCNSTQTMVWYILGDRAEMKRCEWVQDIIWVCSHLDMLMDWMRRDKRPKVTNEGF